jgi:hypothetical protein
MNIGDRIFVTVSTVMPAPAAKTPPAMFWGTDIRCQWGGPERQFVITWRRHSSRPAMAMAAPLSSIRPQQGQVKPLFAFSFTTREAVPTE